MANKSADNIDTIVGNQPIMLPEQGQEMCKHTPQQKPLAPAQGPQSPEPCPRPWTAETHPVVGLEFLGLVTPQKPRPAVRTLREAEVAGNTSVVDVDQQLLGESGGGDSLPHVPLPGARLDGSVGEEWTSPRIA